MIYSKKEPQTGSLGPKLNSQCTLKDGLDNECVRAKVKDFELI